LAASGLAVGSFRLVCLFFHRSWAILLLLHVSLPGSGGFLLMKMIRQQKKPTAQLHASFPFAQNLCFAGKVVFVIRRQQAIMPNHCSQSNDFPYYTFMVLLSLQCPSGCYRRFVMLLAVPPHSSRQLLCPSRHLVHSFLRYASFHLVRSYSFASWLGIP
jgi:hypothetical protein